MALFGFWSTLRDVLIKFCFQNETGGNLNQKERLVIAAVLAMIAFMVGVDIFTDSREGVILSHVLVEGSIGAAALFGVFYVLRGSVELQHRLEQEIKDFSEFKKQAEAFRSDSRKYVDGLSKAIDQQLTKWNLSVAEKEVAFLLLKGMSLKEVAQIRNTTEKTARVQSMAIYAKAGLAGRSELSAFFLEDLLLPNHGEMG
jgi:DNA-binding CsgD family transcriptional regulator